MAGMKDLRRIITVEPVAFLFFTSLYLQNGGGQQFLFYKTCYLKYKLPDVCWNLTLGYKMAEYQDMEDYTVKATSHWILLMSLPLTIPAIFTSICFGSWSDKYGRKPMMILPAFGFLISAIFQVFQTLRMDSPIGISLIGNLVAGLCGGFVTITFATFSYIADITTKECRTQRIGILQSMTFSSSIVGLLTSGVIVQNRAHGFLILYCLVGLCNILLIIYVQFSLPESMEPKKDKYFNDENSDSDATVGSVNEVECKTCCIDLWSPQNFKKVYKDVMKKRPHFDRFNMFLLFMTVFIMQIVAAGDNQIFALYAKDSFSLSPAETGYYTASKMAVLFVVTVVGVMLIRKFNLNESMCCLVGIVILAAGYLGVSLAKSEELLWAMLVFLSPLGVIVGIIRAEISRTVSAEEQGSIFAALASIENLMVFIAAFIFSLLYPATKSVLSGGFVYLVMAELLLIPLILIKWFGELKKHVAGNRTIEAVNSDEVT